MQIKEFDNGQENHNDEQPVRPYIGLFITRSVMGGKIPPGCLPDCHKKADFPVDQALALKDQDDEKSISAHHEYLYRVGVDQAVVGVQDHHRQKKNAHAHLNEPAVKAQRQIERNGDPGVGLSVGVGTAQPAAGFYQDDKQHHDHKEAEDILKRFITHIDGDDHTHDGAYDIEGYGDPASAQVELAIAPECNRTGGTLRKNADAVGAIGQVARQAEQLGKDGQGNSGAVTRQRIDAAGQGASQNCNEVVIPFQLHGDLYLEHKDSSGMGNFRENKL